MNPSLSYMVLVSQNIALILLMGSLQNASGAAKANGGKAEGDNS